MRQAGFGYSNAVLRPLPDSLVSPRDWPSSEKTLSLDYNTQTSSHASAPFSVVLYLKFMCTDRNDKVYL